MSALVDRLNEARYAGHTPVALLEEAASRIATLEAEHEALTSVLNMIGEHFPGVPYDDYPGCIDEFVKDAKLNGAMLAKQCDLARAAEARGMALEAALRECEIILDARKFITVGEGDNLDSDNDYEVMAALETVRAALVEKP